MNCNPKSSGGIERHTKMEVGVLCNAWKNKNRTIGVTWLITLGLEAGGGGGIVEHGYKER
jgi:hypothetical protein